MVLNLRLLCTFRNIVTDYGEENPLFMDYYGFTPESYNLKFSSHGDAQLSQRVVELFNQVPFPSLPSVLRHYFYLTLVLRCYNGRQVSALA